MNTAEEKREKNKQRCRARYLANKADHYKKCREWVLLNQEKARAYKKKYRDANRAKHNAGTRKWQRENKEHVAAVRAAWQEANAAAIVATNAEWVRKNKERHYANCAAWKRKNRALLSEYASARLARTLRATPPWANSAAIRNIYQQAGKMRAAGVDVHVDHIVPLRSKKVCGLHVENNLRIIPAVDNLRKFNTQWPDMPGSANGY